MAWSHEIVGTVTGDRIAPVVLSENSWSVGMNANIGSGDSAIDAWSEDHAAYDQAFWDELLADNQVNARTLVGKQNGVTVWSHPIGDIGYDFKTGRFSLSHREITGIISERMFFEGNAYNPNAEITLGPYTREGMLRALARNATGGGYFGSVGPRYLPVHIDMPQSGGWTRKTRQHQMERPFDWMKDIAASESGLDFVFSPGWGGGQSGDVDFTGHQWVFHSAPLLNRSTHEYHVNAPESPVLKASRRTDTAEHATNVFAVGEGTGAARPVGRASTNQVPETTRVVQVRESNVSSLNALAAGLLSSRRIPSGVWDIELLADRVWSPMHGGDQDGLRPGSRLILHTNDRVKGSGVYELYVTGLSGGLGNSVKVECLELS